MSRGDGGAVFVLVKEAPAPVERYDSPAPAGDDSNGGGSSFESEPLLPKAQAEPAAPQAAAPKAAAPDVLPGEPRVEGPRSAAEGQGFDRTAGPVSGEFTEKGAAEGQGFNPNTAAAEGQMNN